MRFSEASFSGEVTLAHTKTSVADLVCRLGTPETLPLKEEQRPIVIPSLQREFCWDTNDIEALLDSLLRGLPIGSLLLWDMTPSELDANSEAQYQFIKDYANHSNFPISEIDEPVHHHSARLDSELDQPYTFALDGQQRLTSFLIGLRGSFYEHRYRKHTDLVSSYYHKELCLDLFTDPMREPADAQEHLFDFEFRRRERQGYDEDAGAYWWPISNVWEREGDIPNAGDVLPDQCIQTESVDVASNNLSRVHEAITADQISCEIVEGMRSEEALELFIRRNKGGQELSNSDIAFSLITVYWDEFEEDEDPKEVFEDKAAEFSETFSSYSFGFGKGFLIRALLYLDNEKPSFERDNLVPDTIGPLENIWGDRFFVAVEAAFSIVTEEFGLTGKCLSGKTSILPILYYCWEVLEDRECGETDELIEELPEADLNRMEYWLELTVLNNLFGVSSSMTVLDNVRPLIQRRSSFPVSDIEDEYQGGSITIGVLPEQDEDREGISVRELVQEMDHGSETTLRNYLLTKLYDDRGVGEAYEAREGKITSIEVDHFYPAVKLRDTEDRLTKRDIDDNVIDFCRNHVNDFGNFTLLPQGAAGNQSKSEKDPQDWLDSFDNEDERSKQGSLHILPDFDEYSYESYSDFLELRKEEMIKELQKRLVFSNS